MRAVIFKEHGGPEKLEFVSNFPEPTSLGPDEILLRVKTCALNHLDIWVRQGLPALRLPLPHISGCDIAGEVLQGNDSWKQGDEVIVSPGISCGQCPACLRGQDNLCETYHIIGEHIHGGYAQFVKVKTRQLLPKPKNISWEEAASFPLTFLTAWHMLVSRAQLQKDQSVLILGASSGIGVAAIQIARSLGAYPIIAMASSEEKLERLRELGAHETILAKKDTPQPFYRDILRITDRKGVDVIFEHVGASTMESSVRSVKKGGSIVTCGATTGPQANIDLRYFFMREISLLGSIMGTLNELKTINRLVEEGRLKPIVDSTFELSQARAAQEKMLSRNFFGKIVIKVD